MKNIQKSLCSVAVLLGLTMAGQAMAAEQPNLFNDSGSQPAVSSPAPLVSDAPAPAPAPVVVQQAPKTVAQTPSTSSVANDSKDDIDYSSHAQGNVLRKVAFLQSEYALKKVEKDISDLSAKDDKSSNQNQNGMNGQSFQGQNGLPPLPNSVPNQTQAVQVQPVVPQEPVMQATAVYSLGNESYAEILLNGNKFVAKRGMKLPNGYTVSSMNELGVTLVKGKKRATLPVMAVASTSTTSTSGTVSPIVGATPTMASNPGIPTPAGFR